MDTVDPDKPVPLAVIIGAHGVTGEVRLKLFCDSIDSLKQHESYANGKLTLKSVKPHKMGAIARISEIADRNGAEAARGTELTVLRSTLPDPDEGEFYHIDIIGRSCVTNGDKPLGEIFAIYDFGAGDVIEIKGLDGKKFMVPVIAIDMGVNPAVVQEDFVEP